MAKIKTSYICRECGYKSFQWFGQCTKCNAWDSFQEFQETKKPAQKNISEPIALHNIKAGNTERLMLGVGEFDRVLGGGAVSGSTILLAGDPGIGKSTLMLQAASAAAQNGTILYVAGEENPEQIAIRANRLGINGENILIAPANNPDEIVARIEQTTPTITIIDSIQSASGTGLSSGTPSMLREATSTIIPAAKQTGTVCFFIGHVTKEGSIAGPKVIEHMVDVVINFEGEKGHQYRLLRSVKNRFGATDEVGVFQMTDKGLEEVTDPSGLFLSARSQGTFGSVVVPSLQGSRPLLVEVQALVSKSPLAYPRRTALGINTNRFALLAAVLEKSGGLKLHEQDIFLNVAGGMQLKEPASDLGVAAAIYSSYTNKQIDEHTVFLGEVGLSGEVRAVTRLEARLKESAKLGFKKAVVPSTSKIKDAPLEIIKVGTLVDCIRSVLKP